MKTRTWLLAIPMLLIINLAWLWRLDQNTKEFNLKRIDDHNTIIQVNKELYLKNRGWQFTMKTNDQPLPAGLTVRYAENGFSELGSYLGKTKKLVLVVSSECCSTCIDQLFFTVKNEIAPLARRNLLVLYSTSGPERKLWDHRMNLLGGANFLEIPDKSLNLPMDSLDIPYFFVVGPERVARLAYTPYPSLEVQTKEYLNLIEQRYFN